jgi:hypothetical protein
VLHSIPLLYGVCVVNAIQFGMTFAKIKYFGNFTKTSKLFLELPRYICVVGKFLLQFQIKGDYYETIDRSHCHCFCSYRFCS